MSEKISITKDAMKAEAKIRRMRNSRNEVLTRVHDKCLKAEDDYIASLAPEVVAVLVAAQVLAPTAALSAEMRNGVWMEVPQMDPSTAAALSQNAEYIDIEGTLLEEPDATVLS